MRAKLRTESGRAVYAQRKTIVEPVFGQIKEARGFRRFLLRGLAKIRGEWRLVCPPPSATWLPRRVGRGDRRRCWWRTWRPRLRTARVGDAAAGRLPLRDGGFLRLAAVPLAAIAWIPIVGYLEAAVVPAFAARLRGRTAERYAGLRSLAKD